MAKRVIIVHGWADKPSHGWMAWLTSSLESRGVEVLAPHMPEPKRPVVADWVEELGRVADGLDDETVLVGHSMGCPVILRYLSTQPAGTRLAGVVLVAGFFPEPGGRHAEFFGPAPDFDKLRNMIETRICIYSADDDKVEPERSRRLAQELQAQEVALEGRGHFSNYELEEVPEVLAAVESCF